MGNWSRSWVVPLVSLICGCSSSAPSDDPWDGRAQSLPCGFDPNQCLDAPGNEPEADELLPPKIGFRKFIDTADYVDRAGAACPHGFVYDLPRDKLLGLDLVIDSGWPPVASLEELESCRNYAATLHVFAVDPDASGGYRFVDHRSLQGQADSQYGVCSALIESAGPGEPGALHSERIQLTPRLYPFGLRIVSTATESCEPLRLSFNVAEEYPSQQDVPDDGAH